MPRHVHSDRSTRWPPTGGPPAGPTECRSPAGCGAEDEVASLLAVADLGDLVDALRRPRPPSIGSGPPGWSRRCCAPSPSTPWCPGPSSRRSCPAWSRWPGGSRWGSGGDWDGGGAFFADPVTTAWEVIVDWAGDDRDYAVLDLLSAIRCRLRRQLLHQRTGRRPGGAGSDLTDVRYPLERRRPTWMSSPAPSTGWPTMASTRSTSPCSTATASSGISRLRAVPHEWDVPSPSRWKA